MTTLNKIIIVGRLTKDVELNQTGNGKVVANINIAFDTGFGENKKSGFSEVTAWGKTAEFLKSYFSKGKEVLIEGNLCFDQWEKDGQKRSKLFITAERVGFVGSKSDQAETPAEKPENTEANYDLGDEDIPF